MTGAYPRKRKRYGKKYPKRKSLPKKNRYPKRRRTY